MSMENDIERTYCVDYKYKSHQNPKQEEAQVSLQLNKTEHF